MPAFHQMGYQSDNLISCEELSGFKGAILSPVDYEPSGIRRVINDCRNISGFETIFDPQLYFPRTERPTLHRWSYFPNDVETADQTSREWWENILIRLEETAADLMPNGMCSPITHPRVFSHEYYSFMVDIGCDFYDRINPLGIEAYQTAIVNLSDLSDKTNVLNIASIISKTKASRIYLVLEGELEPRRELNETSEISGAMLLINTLEENGIKVLVGFCSSDVLLWKEAGASDCASGKFFNLRRFTPSRWDLNDGGRGHVPYWFEEGLIAYLREPDFIRTQKFGIFSDSSARNPYFKEISESINTGTKWLRLAWRQYLWWFQDVEARLSERSTDAYTLLITADKNWSTIEKHRIFLDERQNDGSWIRAWLRAVTE